MLRLVHNRFVWLLMLMALSTLGYAQNEKPNNDTDSIPDEIKKIDLPNIGTETNALNEKIKRSADYLSGLTKFQKIRQTLIKEEEKIQKQKGITDQHMLTQHSLREVRELEDWWKRKERDLAKVETEITDIFSTLESHRSVLKKEDQRWNITLSSIQEDSLGKVVEENINLNLNNISKMVKRLTDSTNSGLEISNHILLLRDEISLYQTQLEEYSQDQLSDLFFQNQSPLWERDTANSDTLSFAEKSDLLLQKLGGDLEKMHSKNEGRPAIHLLVYFLLLFLLFFVSAKYKSWDVFQLEALKPTIQFIQKPFFTATFLGAYASYWIYKEIPIGIAELLILATLFPLMFILPQLVPKRFNTIIYLIGAMFALEQINSVFGDYDYLKRWLILAEQILALISFIKLWRIQRTNLQSTIRKHGIVAVLYPLTIITILLLVVAIIGNIRGNTALAIYISRAISICAVASFVYYVLLLMIKGFMTIILFGKYSQRSNIVRIHKNLLLNYGMNIARLIFSWLWLKLVLNQFGVYSNIQDYFSEFSDTNWVFGNVNITIGHFIDSIIVVIIAWYLGAIFRSLLKDEILPRFNLTRGLPAAVGISTRYFVLTVGFFLAVASLGIDLEKLGFIAGALSVGIGFGLQNIVGNFISGLILLFERPIVPGDLVNLGEVDGEVQRIGLRSSVVKTWGGAEVIIPNMDLISKQVTNLTLSDKKRRMELIFETETTCAPREIIETLQKAISRHQEVLAEPRPQVLFKGEIKNFYRFRVLYWVTGNVLVMDSEINIIVSEQLKELGVKMAVPMSKVDLGDQKGNSTT